MASISTAALGLEQQNKAVNGGIINAETLLCGINSPNYHF
jgi:hypothetical protein